MPDPIAKTPSDLRPAIVICAWDADDNAWDPVEDLSGLPWCPTGARTVPVAGAAPEALAAALSRHLGDRRCRALLLVGRTTRSDAFRLQTRAENRSLDGRERQDRNGPGTARSTAPVADMVRALRDAGLAVEASSDAEEDAGSYLLYHVLAGLPDGADTPAVGLLRAPVDQTDAAVRRAVKATAEAMTRRLAPLPRDRVA